MIFCGECREKEVKKGTNLGCGNECMNTRLS
jgi:hypothetical protein